jgi:putative nucleotidyltransferase with HDIG domain
MNRLKDVEEYVVGKLKRELAKDLYYHGLHHTLDVLRSAEMIAKEEKISDADMVLLKVAVLYHDIGFTKVYKNHEEVGCDMAREDLPGFGFSKEEIEIICGMIMATRIPQNPTTQLERIIADADLEYLGTGTFDRISRTLFDEIKIYLNVESERQWNIIQMNFLKSHHYYTDFCIKNREAEKQKHLKGIVKIVESYD